MAKCIDYVQSIIKQLRTFIMNLKVYKLISNVFRRQTSAQQVLTMKADKCRSDLNTL